MIIKFFAGLLCALSGWRYEGEVPKQGCVCLAVPHTSNWDGFWLMVLSAQAGMKLSWMIKTSIVRWPWGGILRMLGALPIDRSKRGNMVDRMIAEFQDNSQLILVIPPAGTRSRGESWRSGFYHIARGAQVPVALCFLDYKRKRGGVGKMLHLTGDLTKDMDMIRAYYQAQAPTAKYPENCTAINLKEESPKHRDHV